MTVKQKPKHSCCASKQKQPSSQTGNCCASDKNMTQPSETSCSESQQDRSNPSGKTACCSSNTHDEDDPEESGGSNTGNFDTASQSSSCCSSDIHVEERDCCGSNHQIAEQEKITVSSNDAETYTIYGMDCGSCAKTIENHLNTNPDVQSVSVSFSTGKMKIAHTMKNQDIIKQVKKVGFNAERQLGNGESTLGQRIQKIEFGLVGVTGIFLLVGFIITLTTTQTLIPLVLFASAMIINGIRPVKNAYYAVLSKSLDMNVLMSVAAIGAAFIGEWFEGAVIMWLFAIGNLLQNRSIENTRRSIRSLMNLAPETALVKTAQGQVERFVKDIHIGDTLVIKPGDYIPLDGQISLGQSSINQAPITGESLPVDKSPGDDVYAGTINTNGSIEIEVSELTENTKLAKIIHMVEDAQEKKAPTEAFIDRFASIYTPIVFIAALITIIIPPLFGFGDWGSWFYRGLTLLVVACPCALVISTPVAIVSAIGNAAKNGVLIKAGTFLEKAGHINAIAFDKTGTLTEGRPKVASVSPENIDMQHLLSIIHTLEAHSTHPIATTITDYAKANQAPLLNGHTFNNIPGKGVSGIIDDITYYAGNLRLFKEKKVHLDTLQSSISALEKEGKTIIIIGTDTQILGMISVADSIRTSSKAALGSLEKTGVAQLVMLTGDNPGTAAHIAGQSNINRYFADLLPEDKVKAIEQLKQEGHTVAMVGDGINDAPALATADLGIAMGGIGTDTAMETADIVLMADNLEKLPFTMKLSHKALNIIKQNIWFSLIIKAIALILIVPEWLTLWMAVLSDTGAAIIVILNSLRLFRVK